MVKVSLVSRYCFLAKHGALRTHKFNSSMLSLCPQPPPPPNISADTLETIRKGLEGMSIQRDAYHPVMLEKEIYQQGVLEHMKGLGCVSSAVRK